MIKLYEEIKKVLKENYKYFLTLLCIFLISFVELPYYVDTPGGIVDVRSKMQIEGETKSKGTFNLSYVSELKGTIPVLLYSFTQKDWNILKKEDVILENETEEENTYRNKLLLEETNKNAILVAYQKANKSVTITNQKLFVTYVMENAKTDLKIKDQILKVDGMEVHTKKEAQEIINSKKEGDIISFTVLRNSKEITCKGEIYSSENHLYIGLVLNETKELKTDPEIFFSFEDSESGPSGGLMMTLAIYDALVNEDITKGYTIVGTGTMESDGTVGEIGGVEYKIKGAAKANADIFLVPKENYEEAKEIVKKNNYEITLVSVHTFEDALTYLENLKEKS